MKKHLFTLLLSAAALFCLASCGGEAVPPAPESTPGDVTTEAPAETEPNYVLPEVQIDGFTPTEECKTVRDTQYILFYFCSDGVTFDLHITEAASPEAEGTVFLEEKGTSLKTWRLEKLKNGNYYRISIIAYNDKGERSPEKKTMIYCSQSVIDEAEADRACLENGIAEGTDPWNAIHNINSMYFSMLSGKTDKPIVFFFEGLGTDYSKRFGAMCVAVKDGKILYVNRQASTLPDYPFDPKHDNGKDNPTVIDGVYSFSTTNHNGETACLLVNPPPVVRCTETKGYYSSTASGIEVHRRFADGVAPAEDTWANSSGCFMVGAAGTNEFRDFMIALGILPADTPTLTKFKKSVTGFIVVNHQYAEAYMTEIGYLPGAYKMITAKTTELLEKMK